MKTFTAIVASALLAASASAATAPQGDVPVFHVTGFRTLCTETVSQDCVSTFNISIDSVPSVACSVDWSGSDYQFCGTASPEQAYYAYIGNQGTNGGRSLNTKYTFSLPGQTNTTFGVEPLPQNSPNFDFLASSEAIST